MSSILKTQAGYIRKIGGSSKLYKDLMISKAKDTKLNIVFDVDMTLVHVVKLPSNQIPPGCEGELVEIKIKKSQMFYCISARPGLHNVLDKLGKIAELYVRSNSLSEYCKAIISQIINKEKDYIPLENVFGESSVLKVFNDTKSLKEMGLSTDNTIIIDDQITVWKTEDRNNILLSMKYAPILQDEGSLPKKAYMPLWCNNRLIIFQDWGIFEGNGKISQLVFFKRFIKLCSQKIKNNKSSKISEIIAHYRSQIFQNIVFNIKTKNNEDVLKEIVCNLGGKTTELHNGYNIGEQLKEGAEYSSDYVIYCYLYLFPHSIEKFKLSS